MTNCQQEACDRPAKCRGLCESHYRRALREGLIERLRPPSPPGNICIVENCDRVRKHWHLRCVAHAHRKWVWGDERPDIPVRIRGERPIMDHPLANTWEGIKSRTTRPSSKAWPYYGGRGITMHPEWVNNRAAFLAWADQNLGPRPEGHTLDRIDNDGNYEPGNLRWATPKEQQANSRRTKKAAR